MDAATSLSTQRPNCHEHPREGVVRVVFQSHHFQAPTSLRSGPRPQLLVEGHARCNPPRATWRVKLGCTSRRSGSYLGFDGSLRRRHGQARCGSWWHSSSGRFPRLRAPSILIGTATPFGTWRPTTRRSPIGSSRSPTRWTNTSFVETSSAPPSSTTTTGCARSPPITPSANNMVAIHARDV